MKAYTIPFAGLKIGEHDFDFQVDGTFFENFPESEIKEADVEIHVVLEKQESMLVLNFDIQGVINVICDRCLDEFPFPIISEEVLIVKFGPEYEEVSDDVIVLPATETAIDLEQYIYEYIMTALPIQRIHPDLPDGASGCNKEMLEHFSKMKKERTIDPRWEALSHLKEDNKL